MGNSLIYIYRNFAIYTTSCDLYMEYMRYEIRFEIHIMINTSHSFDALQSLQRNYAVIAL